MANRLRGVGLRIKRSWVRIRPQPLRWVLGQDSLLPLSQGEAFTLASISYLAVLVKYILAKKKNEDATLLSVLRVALGDNESLNPTLRILIPETWRSTSRSRRNVFLHIIVEHDQAELEPKKLETADSSSSHCDVVNRPTYTRGLGDSGNDVLLILVIATWRHNRHIPRLPELLFPAL